MFQLLRQTYINVDSCYQVLLAIYRCQSQQRKADTYSCIGGPGPFRDNPLTGGPQANTETVLRGIVPLGKKLALLVVTRRNGLKQADASRYDAIRRN